MRGDRAAQRTEVTMTASDDAPEPTRSQAARGCAIELIETLALTLVIFFVIQTFIAQPFQVQQYSMERTFEQGQYVLVDRLSHLWNPYGIGQVIVFQPPAGVAEGNDPFIKRVIGVGGDTIELRDGQVYVNGVQLDEPYLYHDDAGNAQPTEATGGQSRWVVPAGDLFVMGDHREVSDDSRIFGPIPVSSVIGRVVLRYWPPSAFGPIETPTYSPAP
jgi:signal peptidase I